MLVMSLVCLIAPVVSMAPMASVAMGLTLPTRADHRRVREVDLIELNHFLDHEGREVFRQVIFYDWSSSAKHFYVRQWRLIRDEDELPRRSGNPEGVRCQWIEKGETRMVQATQLRETWSAKDPEQVNRAILPEDKRRPLFD